MRSHAEGGHGRTSRGHGFAFPAALDPGAGSGVGTGTVHGLFAELGVGTVTASTLQMGLALAGLFAGVGFLSLLIGGGLIWANRETVIPDTVPESFTKETLKKASTS